MRMSAAALGAITVRYAPTLPRPALNRPAVRHGRTKLSCTISLLTRDSQHLDAKAVQAAGVTAVKLFHRLLDVPGRDLRY